MTSPRDEGGIQARRGFIFQDYSLLYYLLIRRLEFPDLEAIIEYKEDDSFVYSIDEDGKTQQVTELIQCKKRESQDSMTIHAGVMWGDEWRVGKVHFDDLKNWVEKPAQQSACDMLKNSGHTYYTLLLFGDPAKRVKKFIPEGFPPNFVLRWPPRSLSEVFPVAYKHQQNPKLSQLTQRTFGTFDIRCRVRILPIASPIELKTLCRILLEEYYQVSERKSPDIVQKLRFEIEKRSLAKSESEEIRRFSQRDIETIIAAGKTEQGRWLNAQQFLEQDNPSVTNPNKGELPRWIDFENGRYAHREEFDRAWEALEQDGFLVVSGAAGTGKTTLCRFLGFRFLKEHPNQRAYYLSIGPTESLNDEIEFLKSQIHSDTLFIVDDQHFAPDEVEELVQMFTDFRLEGKARPRLVVTSTNTYVRTQAKWRGTSALNRATSIAFLPADRKGLTSILDDLRSQAGLDTPLSNDELASLSNGNVELALILARCARELKHHLSFERLFSNKILGQTLTDWVLERLGRGGETEFFQNEIMPVFVVGGYGLPISEDFTRALDALHGAGFLEKDGMESEPSAGFRPTSIYLAFIFRKQHNEQQVDVLSNYLTQYPKQLPAICEQLTGSDYGRLVLKKLSKVCFEKIVKALNNRFEPIGLSGISKVLRYLFLVDQNKSKTLLRRITTNRFFSNFLSLDRTRSVTSLKGFFETIHRIDSDSIRRLADKQLGDSHAKFILNLFELDSCRLDEISACLHAVRKCSREFADRLYDDLKRSPAFIAKITRTDSEPGGLSIWMRFCEELRPLNLGDCYDYLDAHLTPSKVLNAIRMAPEFNPMSLLLLRLRRIHPRLAIDISSELWQDHRDFLDNLLGDEPDLTAICSILHTLSRLNRRIAIEAGFSVKSHICMLLHNEDRYNKISSAVEVFRKDVGLTIAREVAPSIDRNHILPLIQQENHKFALVGKFLYYLTFVSPDLANWFEEHLDYGLYLRKVHISRFHASRLHNLVHLIRGFLTAAHPRRKSELLAQFLDDPLLADEFQHGWREATNLTQIGFCISLLLDSPIGKLGILSLLNMSRFDFKAEILEKLAREKSILHIVNGLFAIAKFDLGLAVDVLEEYVKKIEANTETQRLSENVQTGRRRQHRRPRLLLGNEAINLVDIGCLFQVAAGIDLTQAQQLANLLDLQKFADYAVNEANLGRLAIFLIGLHETSRKLAREFVELICSQEIWKRQYEENEVLENVVHYIRGLGRISRTKGSEYVRFLVENHLNEIQDSLEIEANLMLISNWLRMLPMVGKDFADPLINRMSGILVSTVEYDKRLRHLLEATEALIECDQADLAGQFANRALKETSQMRSVHSLRSWIDLFHKAVRIGRELSIPDFPGRLFAEINHLHFTLMLRFENQPILSAYTYHLLKSVGVSGVSSLKHTVLEQQAQILDASRDERRIVFKALALTLAEAKVGEIRLTAESDGWNYQWERGLAALLFASVFPDDDNPFAMPPDMSPSEWRDLLFRELNEHAGNLEYGLTLHLAAMTGLSTKELDQFQEVVSKRADDELINPTRWLLQQPPGVIDLHGLSYYVWTYIKNTVLRSTYLTWEDDLEKGMDSTVFNKPYVRDLTAILS